MRARERGHLIDVGDVANDKGSLAKTGPQLAALEEPEKEAHEVGAEDVEEGVDHMQCAHHP